MRLAPTLAGFAIASFTTAASAAPQKWPFELDPNITVDPAGTASAIAQGEATLPALRASDMATTTTGEVKLWFWDESAKLLERAVSSGPGLATWPTSPTMCKMHASFALPTLASASQTCAEVDATVRARLADVAACTDVEQPERYVLTFPPAKVDLQVTSSIEGLIGLAGEGLSHHPVPDGLLASDFASRLRVVIAKVRHDVLVERVASAKVKYDEVITLLNTNAGCYGAEGTKLASDVAALRSEIAAAEDWLTKLQTDGNAERQREETCLAARGRTRHSLPFPSMSRADREFIAFWLGGTYFRMRGAGLLPLGSTQQARFFFLQQPFTRIGELTGAKDGADAAFQIFLAIFQPWSEWQDMGLASGDKYGDLVGMSDRGYRQVQGAAQVLGQRGYDVSWLTTGGVQMGPCYIYSFDNLYSYEYAAHTTPPYGEFIQGFTSVGEFCSGASIALGFARTLLDGRSSENPPLDLCSGRACGDDGCGGSCGTCADGTSCSEGRCTFPDGGIVPLDAGSAIEAAGNTSAPQIASASRAPANGSGCGCRSTASAFDAHEAFYGPAALGLLIARAVRRRRALVDRS